MSIHAERSVWRRELLINLMGSSLMNGGGGAGVKKVGLLAK